MKYSLSEYSLYISFRLISLFFQVLPLRLALFFGRQMGRVGYWVDSKHRRIAYRNLRIAFAESKTPSQLKRILRNNYQNLGMNIVETFRLPKVNKAYINKYVNIKGKEFLDNALKDKTGAIILGAHFGSWETCFAIGGILNYPFYMITEEQNRNLLLDRFLTVIRQKHGVGVLKAGQSLREVINALQGKKFVGVVADHGIKEGVWVDFFGKKTLTPTLVMRLHLKYNVPIIVVYLRRIKGAKHELVVLPPLKITKTGDFKNDIMVNLQMTNKVVQEYISNYPEQYLWSYKRFKYMKERSVLLLDDGKTGHLRQSQAILKLVKDIAKKKNLEINTKTVKVDFKNKQAEALQSLGVGLANRVSCQGCLWCLKTLLKAGTFQELCSCCADIVISCGSSLAGVNFVVASENQAKSVVVMRPGPLSIKRFDLVVIPNHDNPPRRNNVVQISGAVNLIDEDCLKPQARGILSDIKIVKKAVLGLLLGGDTKKFRLSSALLKPIISQIKEFLDKYDAEIVITTSRRTSREIENLVKQEFGSYERCPLMVIANERNVPEAVGGILGLSNIVVVSPESISMISEAASSGKYVVVFKSNGGIGLRHRKFLKEFAEKKYIYLADSFRILDILSEIVDVKPEIVKMQNKIKVQTALEKLLG